MHLELCRLAEIGGLARVLFSTALSLSCRAFFGFGGHFSWHAQGKRRALVVQSRLLRQVQEIGAASLRCAEFRGSRRALAIFLGAL